MRITVDIPDDKLRELLEITGEKKMSPAVSKAVLEYIKRMKSAEFGELIKSGTFDLKE
ncbi:MAG: DUF2191 domain-containing protein [Puniceicoccaceae bacterium]